MKILELFQDATSETKLFILFSLLLLILIQLSIYKYARPLIGSLLFVLIHVLFGLLLSRISSYNVLIHLVIYAFPSFLISTLLYLLLRRKENTGPALFELSSNKGTIKFNPFRHFGIFGGSGSGKTQSIFKPCIENMATYRFSGIIYDYKEFQLSSAAYTLYKDTEIPVYTVNFFEPSFSYQVNPINPELMISPAHANEAAHILIKTLSSSKGNAKDPFWEEAAEACLAGVIWKFVEDMQEDCYLPYVISVCLGDQIRLLDLLRSNIQSSLLAAPLLQSVESDKTIASILTTLSNALRKLATPEIFYVLNGNDFSLDLNDTKNPALLCISTIEKVHASCSPAISLIVSTAIKLMNTRGKHPSGLLLDEGPTIYIPNIDNVAATARENNMFLGYGLQDIVQAEDMYGRIGRDKILSNLGTQFFGRVTDPQTAERYSKIFGRFDKKVKSTSRKTGTFQDFSVTTSTRESDRFKINDFIHLKEGEFMGIVAGGNLNEFNVRFREYTRESLSIPMVKMITKSMLNKRFNEIIQKAETISI